MSHPSRIACVFPGQGSQSVGMLKEFASSAPVVREVFQEATDVLEMDLWSLVANGPEADLNRTENTQPAMLAAGVAVWRTWCAADGAYPQLMAGHSLGEYTALVCAGALDFADAVRLVRKRAQAMQQAVREGEGAMAAVLGLEDAEVVELCARAAQGQVVSAVNFNAPAQVVIAGEAAAVERAIVLASQAGAKRAVRLPVSVPAHCSLMRPAAQALAPFLAEIDFKSPDIPVLHNVDTASHRGPNDIRDVLARQMYSPVRWVETVRAFAADGVGTVLELGPGRALTGLNKRIDRALQCLCVQDSASLDQALNHCKSLHDA
jgi:[acyl-carrier-protein] S-malonyltransferase